MPFSPLAKLAAAALVLVSAAVNAQQRDEAVLKAAEAVQPAVIETLQKLVLIESGSAKTK